MGQVSSSMTCFQQSKNTNLNNEILCITVPILQYVNKFGVMAWKNGQLALFYLLILLAYFMYQNQRASFSKPTDS